MMYSLHRAVLPVDTHVARVARRLQLIEEDCSASRVHDALAAVVQPRLRYCKQRVKIGSVGNLVVTRNHFRSGGW